MDDSCDECFGAGWIDDGLACDDPECCGMNEVPCLSCNPTGEVVDPWPELT